MEFSNHKLQNIITIDSPGERPYSVMLDQPDLWRNRSAGTLSFHWDPLALLDEHERQSNTTQPEFNVDLYLCAYRENVMANASWVSDYIQIMIHNNLSHR